jgi:hypothetical protein
MQEHSGPPMPPPLGRNWEMFVDKRLLHAPDELDLKTLRPGDRLAVATRNTQYEFEWLEGGAVLLRTDRADRPWGQVSLTGCVFRRSGILAPGVIFKGGKLQFLSMDGQVKHQTTLISSFTLIRQAEQSDPKAELSSSG